MTTIQNKITTFWQDAINLVLGVWLIVSLLRLARQRKQRRLGTPMSSGS